MEWHREEPTALDVCRIQELLTSLGSVRAREVISDVALEIIAKSARLDRALERGDLDLAARLARSIACLSEQVGLMEFSISASNLYDCASRKDLVALPAVAARASRLGETASHMLLELSFREDL